MAQNVLRFCAVEVDLPDHNLRLLNAPSKVTFDGKTFKGRDATYGVLGGVESISDGGDEQVPSLTITLLPPDVTAASVLASPNVQGARVRVYSGDLDPIFGDVLDTPDLLFDGAIDVPTMTGDLGQRALQYSVDSEFDKLFELDEGALLNNAFHRSVHPDERGFEYVTDVQQQLPIGMDAPRPVAVRDITP